MVHQCAAQNCKNSKKGFLMSHFPRDRKIHREWLIHLKREKWIPVGDSVVCDIHFAPEMWHTRQGGKRTLKRNAIPTVFPQLAVDFDDSTDSLSDTITLSSTLSTRTVFNLFSCDEIIERPLENAKKKIKIWEDSSRIPKKREGQIMENKPSCSFKDKKEDLEETDSKIQEGEKIFICNICDYNCEGESIYDLHVKIHTLESLLSCPHPRCYYLCSRPWQLMLHEKTHIGE